MWSYRRIHLYNKRANIPSLLVAEYQFYQRMTRSFAIFTFESVKENKGRNVKKIARLGSKITGKVQDLCNF